MKSKAANLNRLMAQSNSEGDEWALSRDLGHASSFAIRHGVRKLGAMHCDQKLQVAGELREAMEGCAARNTGFGPDLDFECVSIHTCMVSSRELIRLIQDDGWAHVATKGSHWQFKHPVKPGRVTVPHPKHDLPAGTVSSVLKQAGLK